MSSLRPPDQIVLQDRDLNLLRTLFECRVMTAAQIAAIHFEGRREAAKKRLQRLKAEGLIAERDRLVNEPSILYLAKSGFEVLKNKGVLSEYPSLSAVALEKRARVSDLTIRHELAVLDVKAAFHSAVRNSSSFTIAEFSTWPRIHEFTATHPSAAETTVRPDGFVRIHEGESDGSLSEHAFFLEVDRSTESQDTLASKAVCYFDYFKSGGFAERNGADATAYKEYPFRVLMVLKSPERRNNLAARLLRMNPPILTHACLATFDEVQNDPLGAIWMCPIDYREAVAGTAFDVDSPEPNWAYQRQSAREVLIEQTVKKRKVLST